MSEGSENVVGFEVFFSERLDTHSFECFLEQRDLADKLWRCLATCSLVFGVLASAE